MEPDAKWPTMKLPTVALKPHMPIRVPRIHQLRSPSGQLHARRQQATTALRRLGDALLMVLLVLACVAFSGIALWALVIAQ
jgi:hypothetical protein